MKYAILFNVCGIVPPFVLLFLGRILSFLMKANIWYCYMYKKFKSSSTRLIEHSMRKKQTQANSFS